VGACLALIPNVRLHLSVVTLLCIPATAAVVACGSGNDSFGLPSGRFGTTATQTVGPAAEGGSAASDASSDGASQESASGISVSFTLIDTNATNVPDGSPIPGFDPIPAGAVINLLETGQWVSLRADLPASAVVGSAVFVLDGVYVNADDTAPFTMCGEDVGDASQFSPCPLTDGKHDLTLTLYAPQSLGGQLVSVTQFAFGIAASDYDGGVFDDMPDADAGDDADACCP
jgi:hypothetical protein